MSGAAANSVASISSIDRSFRPPGGRRDRPDRVEHGRRVARERREDRRRREAEHPRVPDVVAGGEVLARLLEPRLLDEAARRERRRRAAGERIAAFDVAEARLGMRRG